MSTIDEWKDRAASYLEDAGKKKDELVEKAALLKKEYDENQRKKMEEWVYRKEAELKDLEKTLKKHEQLLRQRELKLNSKFFVRFVGVAAGLSVIGFFALVLFITITETGKHSSTTQVENYETKVPLPKSSEPYTRRESAVYSTYGDIDAKNPNFDVGNYCLEKEKRGGVSFNECLGVAAAKIMSRQ